MSEHGITVAEANAGQVGTPEQQVSRLRAEVAALRQRAEAAERERDAWLASSKELEQRAETAEDRYRRAVNALRVKGRLVEALERCARWTPIGEDHSCATAALKAAKETP